MMLNAKIHRARVTHAELDYEGSCAIDKTLLDSAGICEYEQIQIYNISNGERFTTYAIVAPEHSGIVSLNGAAAHKGSPNDLVIICSFVQVPRQQLSQFRPTLVYVDQGNNIVRVANAIAEQVA